MNIKTVIVLGCHLVCQILFLATSLSFIESNFINAMKKSVILIEMFGTIKQPLATCKHKFTIDVLSRSFLLIFFLNLVK